MNTTPPAELHALSHATIIVIHPRFATICVTLDASATKDSSDPKMDVVFSHVTVQLNKTFVVKINITPSVELHALSHAIIILIHPRFAPKCVKLEDVSATKDTSYLQMADVLSHVIAQQNQVCSVQLELQKSAFAIKTCAVLIRIADLVKCVVRKIAVTNVALEWELKRQERQLTILDANWDSHIN